MSSISKNTTECSVNYLLNKSVALINYANIIEMPAFEILNGLHNGLCHDKVSLFMEMSEMQHEERCNATTRNDTIKIFNEQLEELEKAAKLIKSKYTNGYIKPFEEAQEDVFKFMEIIENILVLRIQWFIAYTKIIKDEPSNDVMNKQTLDLFYNINPFAMILSIDIIAELILIRSHKNLVGKINGIRNAAMALGGTGIIDDEIRKCENLVEQLLELREPATSIDKRIEEPLQYVEHTIHDDLLLPKLNDVQTILDKKHRSLENRAIVETLAPQVELITANLKKNLDDYETIFTGDLERQQTALNDLTQQKHKFEEYNKKIPDGPEGNEIRKIIQENLSHLSNILEKLENVITKKAAAHALFISSKCAVEKELRFLNDDITKIESDIDDATLNILHDRINVLDVTDLRIDAIHSKLSDELINRNILDTDKQEELDKLHEAINAAMERLINARNCLTTKLVFKQIEADTNRYHSDLSELIHQVHQLLVNPTAIPKSYHDLCQQINDKTEAINKLIQHANNSGNSSAVQPLNDLISQSMKAEADLTLRYNLWIEFEKERDNFIDQISRARNALNKFEENADLRPLSVAENQFETLKIASSAFNKHHSTLLKLQNLSEQLNPCEMPNRDFKSIVTDWEQTNECFENNLNNLLNEINEEREITDDINKITGEILHFYNDMSSFTRENLVDILDKTLPTFRIEAERLIKMDTDAIHNRRIVIRDKKPSLQDIDFKKCLNELEKTVRQNIEAIDSEKFDTKFLYTIPKPITTDEENFNVVGIDLGMTRCCVAVKRKYGIQTVALENIGGRMLPSYIGYDEQHTKCGQIVIDRLRYFPEAVVFDLKRIIGRNAVAADKIWPFKVITVDKNLMIKLNTPYGEVTKKPTEVAAVLLKYMKEKTEIFQGQNLEKAVITVPTTFTSAQEEATREAAEIAGWKTVVLLPEPIAAAFAYFIDTKISNNSNILLFDLGGGTLDVCVFKISNNQIRIKSKKGDSRLGGRDFDNLLLNYFINKLKLDHDITVSGGRKFKLLLECQNIKHNLTDREIDQLDIEDYDQNKPGFIKISQQDFRELSQDLLNRIKNTVRSALYSSGYKSSQISKVLHVGGGCRMPMIKELLHKMFPTAEPCCKENPEEVVAVGAAYYAYNIFPTN